MTLIRLLEQIKADQAAAEAAAQAAAAAPAAVTAPATTGGPGRSDCLSCPGRPLGPGRTGGPGRSRRSGPGPDPGTARRRRAGQERTTMKSAAGLAQGGTPSSAGCRNPGFFWHPAAFCVIISGPTGIQESGVNTHCPSAGKAAA